LVGDVGGRFPETDAYHMLVAERLRGFVVYRMQDLTTKRVSALVFRHTGNVDAMRAGAQSHRVEYRVRDRTRLLVAGGDAKPIMGDVALNGDDLSLKLDMRQQRELLGKVPQVGGIFLATPETALVAQRRRKGGKSHVVLRHRQRHRIIGCPDRIVEITT